MKKLILLAALAPLTGFGAIQTFSDTLFVVEGIDNDLSLTQFDSDLGTLNSVTLTVTLSVPSFDIIVDNDFTNAADFQSQFGTLGGVTFASTANTLDGSFNQLGDGDFSIATQSSGVQPIAGNDSDSVDSFDVDGGPDN